MKDMEHSFEPSTIQKMELTILHALDWRLACTTAYSYLEMFTRITFKAHLHQEIVTQVYDLLLRAISGNNTITHVYIYIYITACRKRDNNCGEILVSNDHFTAPSFICQRFNYLFSQNCEIV